MRDREENAIEAAPAGANGGQTPSVGRDRAAAPKRSPRDRRLSAKARAAAILDAEGALVVDLCAQVPCSRASLKSWRARPDWQAARERHRAEIREAAEHALLAARPAAVKALRVAAEKGDTDASRALLVASQTPSDVARQRARSEVLAALPARLRAVVVDCLDGVADLRGMTDDELRKIAGGES